MVKNQIAIKYKTIKLQNKILKSLNFNVIAKNSLNFKTTIAVVIFFYWWISIHSSGFKLTLSKKDFQGFNYLFRQKYEFISQLGYARRLCK